MTLAVVGQRPSHDRLLVRPGPVPPAEIPAIVVPTIRPPAAVRDALHLGRELDRPVVTLCSGWSSATKVCEEARQIGSHVVAVTAAGPSILPAFTCDELLRGAPARRLGLHRQTDVSSKRNLGIAAARMLGWRGVFFLDDDITDVQPEAVRTAAGLLAEHRVAALDNDGFPDNSVVCHARREVGLEQGTFVGGGALAVRVDRKTPFFPAVYNEDWLFLAGRRRIEPVAVSGKVSQNEYDPYLSPERARSEEFGDCLAEGLFALAGRDQPVTAATEAYWREFLAARVRMIDEVLARLAARNGGDRHARIVQALTMARGRCLVIDPAFCVGYLRAWQADLEVWRRFLAGLPRRRDPREAFEALGMTVREHRP
jgi:hypothetical protein